MKSWRNPLLLLVGIGVSNLGSWVYLVAINLLVIKMTGSPAAVAAVFIIRPIAMLLTNTWAGSVVDRTDQRKLLITVDILRGVLVGLIPLMPSIWGIFTLMLLANIAGAFFGPASNTYITKLVPAENRLRFNSLFSFANSGAFLIGPALSGFLILNFEYNTAIYLNAISFFVCAAALVFLPSIKQEEKAKQRLTFKLLLDDWSSVITFGKKTSYFILVYVLFQAAMLIGYALDSQEVTFIKQVLHLTDRHYGMLVSITGIGYLAGSAASTALVHRFSLKSYLGLGLFFNIIGYLAFFSSSTFLFAAFAFVVLGFFASFANAGITTFMQNQVPSEIMGRFISITSMLQGVLQIILTLVLGFVSSILSLQVVCIAFAIVSVLLAGWLFVVVHLPKRESYFHMEKSTSV